MPTLRDEIRERFNALELHDSRLADVSVRSRDDGSGHDIAIDLELLRGHHPNYSHEPAQLVLLDCTYVRLDMDLDGKLVCGDAIGRVECVERSPLREALERGPMKYEDNPLSEYLHFSIFLIPPGGEMHVFAKDFVLKQA